LLLAIQSWIFLGFFLTVSAGLITEPRTCMYVS
jgi:hypothetical protein